MVCTDIHNIDDFSVSVPVLIIIHTGQAEK